MQDLVIAIMETICSDIYVAIRDHDYDDLYVKVDGKKDVSNLEGWEFWKGGDTEALDNEVSNRRYLPYPDGALYSRIHQGFRPSRSLRDEHAQVWVYQGDLFTDDEIANVDFEGWVLQVHIDIEEPSHKGVSPSSSLIHRALTGNGRRRRRDVADLRIPNTDEPPTYLRDLGISAGEFSATRDRAIFLKEDYPNIKGKLRSDNEGLITMSNFFRVDAPAGGTRTTGTISETNDENFQIALETGPSVNTIITYQVIFNTYREGKEPYLCVAVDDRENPTKIEHKDGYAIVPPRSSDTPVAPIYMPSGLFILGDYE